MEENTATSAGYFVCLNRNLSINHAWSDQRHPLSEGPHAAPRPHRL